MSKILKIRDVKTSYELNPFLYYGKWPGGKLNGDVHSVIMRDEEEVVDDLIEELGLELVEYAEKNSLIYGIITVTIEWYSDGKIVRVELPIDADYNLLYRAVVRKEVMRNGFESYCEL